MDVDIAHDFFACKLCSWFVIQLSAGNDMRIDPGGSQTEGEIAEQLTGCGVVGKKETIKKDDAFHRSAGKPGRAPRTRGAQVKPLSRIRVGPAPGRFHP